MRGRYRRPRRRCGHWSILRRPISGAPDTSAARGCRPCGYPAQGATDLRYALTLPDAWGTPQFQEAPAPAGTTPLDRSKPVADACCKRSRAPRRDLAAWRRTSGTAQGRLDEVKQGDGPPPHTSWWECPARCLAVQMPRPFRERLFYSKSSRTQRTRVHHGGGGGRRTQRIYAGAGLRPGDAPAYDALPPIAGMASVQTQWRC